MHEVYIDNETDDNTDSLWCSFLIDPQMILLNIPVDGLKLFDFNLQQLKQIKPSEISEYFLDLDIWSGFNGDWLSATEIDLSEEKKEFNLEQLPSIYKGQKDGEFTQWLFQCTFDFKSEEVTCQFDRKNSILLQN